MLQDKVIGIYCLIDDILKSIGHYEPGRRQISDSELITTALVSALYFKGNQSHTMGYMRTHKMIPGMNASKREYFYGVKVQLVTTKQGIPVEVCFVPGSEHDVEALKKMYLDLLCKASYTVTVLIQPMNWKNSIKKQKTLN